MIRASDIRRTAKTIVRKASGIDRRYRDELMRQARLSRLVRVPVLQMDAAHLLFADESFDFVYSTTVFHHLADPGTVADEIVRVLRPGGTFYIDFIPFTSKTGQLDIRAIGGRKADVPAWAHLRPQLKETVRESAYLNRLSIREWLQLFQERAPGCQLIFRRPNAEQLEQQVRRLWSQGELLKYELEELVTAEVVVIWQKPVTA
jgi:ubiquinone/menaquinone biosynthesis C-methylase UbiE